MVAHNFTSCMSLFLFSEVLHMSEFCHKRQMQLIPVVEVGPKVQFEALPKLYSVFQDFLACFGTAE